MLVPERRAMSGDRPTIRVHYAFAIFVSVLSAHHPIAGSEDQRFAQRVNPHAE